MASPSKRSSFSGNGERKSALTALFEEASKQEPETPTQHPGLQFSSPDPASTSFNASYYRNHVFKEDGFDWNAANEFRDYATGAPRITAFPGYMDRPRTPRRSTLADKPELDHRLMPYRALFHGVQCLILSKTSLMILSHFINGIKPISDLSVFTNLAIDFDLAKDASTPLLSTLEFISQQVTGIVVITGAEGMDPGTVVNECRAAIDLLDQRKELKLGE
jgi:hypothetical protein